MATSPRVEGSNAGVPQQIKRYTPVVAQTQLQAHLDRARSKNPNDMNAFRSSMAAELKSYDDYCTMTYNLFYQKVFGLVRHFTNSQVNPKTVEQEADQLVAQLIEFNTFMGTQYKLYKKLLTKFEKTIGGDETQVEGMLLNMPFARIGFGDLVTILSDVYHSLRKIFNVPPPRPDPSSFKETKMKFFLRLEDVLKFKLSITKYLPVLRPGKQQGVIMDSASNRRYSGFQHLNNGYDGGGEGDGFYQTVIYLDNDQLDTYHGKMFSKDGATLIRIRWSGEEGDMCTVEVATPHSSMLNMQNMKERFDIPYAQVKPFLTGALKAQKFVDSLRSSPDFNAKNLREISSLCELVQRKTTEDELRPAIRSISHRAKFQYSDFNSIRIIVDTTTHISMEPKDPGPNRFCRDINQPIPPGEALMFPLAVVEVKMHSLPQTPSWLQKILDAGYLIEAQKFSKFIHGTAALTPAKTQVLPSWFNLPYVHLPGYPLTNWYCGPSIPIEAAGPNDFGSVSKFAKPMRSRSTRFTNDEIELPTLPPTSSSTASANLVNPITSPKPVVQTASAPNLAPKKDGFVDPPKATSSPIWSADGSGPGVNVQDNSLLGKLKRLVGIKEKNKGVGGLTPLLPAIRVEPKTYFANERTLLQWLDLGVWFAFAALAIFTLSNTIARGIGGGILVFGILLGIYAFGVYQYRRRAIVSRDVDGHFDDAWGPTIVVVFLVLYLIGAMLFQYFAIIPDPNVLPIMTITRSYRLEIVSNYVTNPNPVSQLRAIYNLIKRAAPSFTFTGDLSTKVSTRRDTYLEARAICTLSKFNGYRLHETVQGGVTRSNLEFRSQDYSLVGRLDKLRSPRDQWNATDIITAGDQFFYARTQTYTITRAEFPRLQSVANYFANFPLWQIILPAVWTTPIEPAGGDNTVDTYGGVTIDFGNAFRKGQLLVEVWKDLSGVVKYAEVHVDIVTTEIDLITPVELSQSTQFFKAIRNLVAFTNATADPALTIYIGGAGAGFCN